MLLIAEKSIRGGICHSIYQNENANNGYMKDYDKIKESSYIQHVDVNNLYGWAMLQKLTVNSFEWIKDTSQFNEDFIKNYREESDKGYFLEVDVQCTEKLNKLQNYLLFFTREGENWNSRKACGYFTWWNEYVFHIRNLKQALNHI